MSIEEAKRYYDVVVESLHEIGVLSESQYGRLTENQRDEIADKIVAASEE